MFRINVEVKKAIDIANLILSLIQCLLRVTKW